MYIEKPKEMLPTLVKIGAFSAKIVCKQSTTTTEQQYCGKCLEEGHTTYNCSKPVKCRLCKLDGHIARDCARKNKQDGEKFPPQNVQNSTDIQSFKGEDNASKTASKPCIDINELHEKSFQTAGTERASTNKQSKTSATADGKAQSSILVFLRENRDSQRSTAASNTLNEDSETDVEDDDLTDASGEDRQYDTSRETFSELSVESPPLLTTSQGKDKKKRKRRRKQKET